MICNKIIPTIAAAAKKSNTNKDKKTVCMVGCLYNIGARAHTIGSKINKHKQHKQGQENSVHGGVSLQYWCQGPYNWFKY